MAWGGRERNEGRGREGGWVRPWSGLGWLRRIGFWSGCDGLVLGRAPSCRAVSGSRSGRVSRVAVFSSSSATTSRRAFRKPDRFYFPTLGHRLASEEKSLAFCVRCLRSRVGSLGSGQDSWLYSWNRPPAL